MSIINYISIIAVPFTIFYIIAYGFAEKVKVGRIIVNSPNLLPLMLIRPISGSASTAVALDIMKNFGVDSLIRNHGFYYHGFYRNNFIHNSYLYKRS